VRTITILGKKFYLEKDKKSILFRTRKYKAKTIIYAIYYNLDNSCLSAGFFDSIIFNSKFGRKSFKFMNGKFLTFGEIFPDGFNHSSISFSRKIGDTAKYKFFFTENEFFGYFNTIRKRINKILLLR
jgi:hypothetical protein